jgi:hypothetical protein
MNANGLARLYDRLSIWERIPLLLAADARDDASEYRRLSETAPVRTWQFPEHLLAEQALHVLALIYVGEQLDAAARFLFALWQLGGDDDPDAEEWLLAANACAYFFAANADAWRRFCAGLDIEAGALTAANHPAWFLPYCEEHMPAYAPTAEALQARFQASGWNTSPLVTADSLLASWQNLLHSMTGHTPREPRKGAG